MWAGRSHFAVARLRNGDILLAGGSSMAAANMYADVWRSDDDGRTWALVADAPGWPPHFAGAMVVTSDDVVLEIGGTMSGGTLDTVWASFNNGDTWELLTTVPWGDREVVAVTLGNGVVLVAGGVQRSPNVRFNDVWVSDSGGESWTLATAAAPWAARFHHAMVAVSNTSAVLSGGQGDFTFGKFNDVWLTHDAGVTWGRMTAAAPWTPRHTLTMGGLLGSPPGGLILLGGTNDLADAWVSWDYGATWSPIRGGVGTKASRLLVLPGNRVLVMGGADAVDSVWEGRVEPLWGATDCDSLLGYVCTADELPHGGGDISVSLPAAAGVVSPPNTESAVVGVVYAPPVPSMRTHDGQALVTSSAELSLDVQFSSPVGGLQGTYFDVTAHPLTLSSARVHGGGMSYQLDVKLNNSAIPVVCPLGYTLSGGAASSGHLCLRELSDRGTWWDQQSACAPFDLATVTSEPDMVAVAGARTWAAHDHWYALKWAAAGVVQCVQYGPALAPSLTCRRCVARTGLACMRWAHSQARTCGRLVWRATRPRIGRGWMESLGTWASSAGSSPTSVRSGLMGRARCIVPDMAVRVCARLALMFSPRACYVGRGNISSTLGTPPHVPGSRVVIGGGAGDRWRGCKRRVAQ